ncbi:hypothetical protein F5Y10DRAFT_270930 [Nemania abortiva]|nr:hypothetical protein F5Y10DRAFT_270930 [Nemania abortiva]
MLLADAGTAPGQHQPQMGVSSSDGPPDYPINMPAYIGGYQYGGNVGGPSVPVAPIGGLLPSGRAGENIHSPPQPWGAGTFSPINVGYQGASPGSLMDFSDFSDEAHRPASLDELSSPPDQQSNTVTAELSLTSRLTPARTRAKRKSKYTDEPPQSIYGPPFVSKEIPSGLSQEEVGRRVEHNRNVAEARKVYMRFRNNQAAKKSRERKQALIDELTAEKQRLDTRLREMTAGNRGLADVTARLQTAESDNDRLRRENEALRHRVGDLTRKIDELEHERDADWSNAMLSIAHQPGGQTSGGGGVSADTDKDISQFLNEFNNGFNNSGDDGSFGWGGPGLA